MPSTSPCQTSIESARRIVADKERIMLDAEKKAEDTVAQAKDYIARITEESEHGQAGTGKSQ